MSYSNYHLWNILEINKNRCEQISEKLNVNPKIIEILLRRIDSGYSSEDIEQYIKCDLDMSAHDPFLLKDAEKAVSVLSEIIKNNGRILLFGDYDADGITGIALLSRYFIYIGKQLHREIQFDAMLPDRLSEGYGINPSHVEMAAKHGYDLIITVDNGMSSLKACDLAKKKGIKVIIIDHHTPQQVIPSADAIINPKQEDCQYPNKSLVGVGLSLKFAQAATFKMLDVVHAKKIAKIFMDLVAIGTYQDVAPLLGENRALVKYGLGLIRKIIRNDESAFKTPFI